MLEMSEDMACCPWCGDAIAGHLLDALRQLPEPQPTLTTLASEHARIFDAVVNANGPLYGSPEYSSDIMPILDPAENKATTFRMPVRDAQMPLSLGPGHAAALKALHRQITTARR